MHQINTNWKHSEAIPQLASTISFLLTATKFTDSAKSAASKINAPNKSNIDSKTQPINLLHD
ncbi:hypothetical protein GCM10025791_48190 [Halioxenophilus aromaticivorans]|uniref:Uncharacterized protein n=1 Tax=Halioxenophilus aromaticivorans TaxID=1306992 RepID=A0AAV3U9Z3_9ALTE